MRSLLKKKWLLIVLRLFVGVVFLYAGVLKIQAPQAFADSIASFQMVPYQLIGVIALTLPIMEIVTGVALVVGPFQRLAAFAGLVMALVFGVALGSAILRGLEVDCGCFGGAEPSALKTWISFGRDLVLFGATLCIYYRGSNDDDRRQFGQIAAISKH